MSVRISPLFCSLILAATSTASSAAVNFIGEGSLPGTTRDQSGLSGLLEDGVTPHNLVGGFGSAITYSGKQNLYIATPDRGPADGNTSYIDRFYTISIDVKRQGSSQYSVTPKLVDTQLMKESGKTYYTGSNRAFDPTGSPESLRFDPEGVRVSRCGDTAFVSDEYGPYLYEFKLKDGKRVQSLAVPNKFLIDYPSSNPTEELALNVSGRQSNQGMEGLAISPDGGKLYGIMQSPLIQDGGLNAALSRVGINNRIVEVDVETGAIREFLYRMDVAGNGISEIVAVNDHEFLVLERDGRAGAAAQVKKIYKIDINGATDIRKVKQLPQTDLPAGITPVSKSTTPFIDCSIPASASPAPPSPKRSRG
jgi:hypothetical protein